jgi:ubiquinone/menaquinone biosynthesis C-methylase UbiE
VAPKQSPASAPETKGIRIRWPRIYDVLNRVHFLGREELYRERTVDLAVIQPGEGVLDVGCGTGNLTLAAKERVGKEGAVHGIDAAPEMIAEAQRKAAASGIAVDFRVGLIENLEFPDGHFDVVLSSLMLHHLPKDLKVRGVAEIARVLKPKGRFLAVDVDPWLMKNLDTVEVAMGAAGFTEIERGRTGFRTLWIPIHFLGGRRRQSRSVSP